MEEDLYLDPSAMPAEIDFMQTIFPVETEFISIPGIYELDGDSLTICFGFPEEFEPGTRPDKFESSRDYPTVLVVLRRVEDDE